MSSLLFSVAMLFTLTSKTVSDDVDHGAQTPSRQDLPFVYPSKQAMISPSQQGKFTHKFYLIKRKEWK